jgi:voltage-gated potassium channel
MPSLRQIILEQDTKQGRAFDLSIQALIVFSAVSLAIETLPNLSSGVKEILRQIEVGIILIFTVEYLLRLYLSEKKFGFVFSFYGIVDLIAIAPFYLTLGLDLTAVRGFRLIRLVRLLKLARYSKAMQRFHIAFGIVREEVVLFICFALFLLYLSALGIYHFEHQAQPEVFASVIHSLWWAVATLTTVGYGDIYPVTVGGKIFTFFILIIGMGIVAVPAGLVASALTKTREMEE